MVVHDSPVSCVPLLVVEVHHRDQWFEVGAWDVGGIGEKGEVVEVVEVKKRLRHSHQRLLYGRCGA